MSDVQDRTEPQDNTASEPGMVYIKTGLEWTKDGHLVQSQEQSGARKYEGAVAQQYNAKRETSPKWLEEQAIIEDMLSDLPSGDWVLDVPVGTGRFLKYYNEKGFLVRGVDMSPDMLTISEQSKPEGLHLMLYRGDVRGMNEMDDKCNDAACMIRLTRWLDPEGVVQALEELKRVTRKKIIFTARVRHHPQARGYDLITAALGDWTIHRDEGLPSDDDYRVIELRPKDE